MSDLTPTLDAPRVATAGIDTATSKGVVLTASATPNSEGAWTQIVASAPFDVAAVLVNLQPKDNESSSRSYLLDIGVGAAASEQAVIPDLFFGNTATTSTAAPGVQQSVLIPVAIPAGARIAARLQASAASMTATLGLELLGAGFLHHASFGGIDALGIDAANSRGTRLTTSASINTKGSWAQLIASTARDYRAILPCVIPRGTSGTVVHHLADIGIGAAASEAVLLPDLWAVQAIGGAASAVGGFRPLIPCEIPAGSRVAARSQATVASQSTDVALYGLY